MKNVAMYITAKDKRMRSAQEKVIRNYCGSHEMNVVETVTGSVNEVVFGDWFTGRRIDAVVVAYSGDVTESMPEFYAYRSIMRRRHSDLIAVNEDREWSATSRVTMMNLINAICQIELENEPIRQPHDRIDKAARGKYIGGNAPMGYRIEDGKLVVNEAEVPAVLLILQRKHEGKSKLSTVDALNQNGYKTRNGKPFVISTVQSIWNNEEFYRGYRKDKNEGKWVRGEHKALLEG